MGNIFGAFYSQPMTLILLIVCLFWGYSNGKKIEYLTEELDRLKLYLRSLKESERQPGPKPEPQRSAQPSYQAYQQANPASTPKPESVVEPSRKPTQETFELPKSRLEELQNFTPLNEPKTEPAGRVEDPKATPKSFSDFEREFGARLPVWIGAVALAFAGFFLVKYSIEMGLLGYTVRVVMGLIFGSCLLIAAEAIRQQPQFANGGRISQALSGAGIADLYISIFAASSFYHLISPILGFCLMTLVTLIAIVSSLKHGMPVAVIGLIGGFLSPTMTGSTDPNAPTLFLYLFFLICSMMIVIQEKGWWILAIPTILGGFSWVSLWVLGNHFSPSDNIWTFIFLGSVSALVVQSSRVDYETELTNQSGMFESIRLASIDGLASLNYLTLGGTLLIMNLSNMRAGFQALDWGLYGLISIAGIILAGFNQKLYGLVPWLSMFMNTFMIVFCYSKTQTIQPAIIFIFSLIYVISGYILQLRSQVKLGWAGLVSATCLIYYLISFALLHDANFVKQIPMFWGMLALGLSVLSIGALTEILNHVQETDHHRQPLLAIYSATATAFLSIGLTIELHRDFLSIAIAAELLTIAWLNTKLDIKMLKPIAGLLACLFGLLLLPQIFLLIELTAYSIAEAKLELQDGVPIVNWPMFQLGLPGLFFLMSSNLIRQKDEDPESDTLSYSLDGAVVALFGVMGYYLTRHAFHIDSEILFVKAGFFERGVTTNILYLFGICCIWIGKQFSRKSLSHSGYALVAVAVFRILFFDFFFHNPLWTHENVGQSLIFNALLLTYGLPIIWTWLTNLEFIRLNKSDWSEFCYGFMLLLAFILVSMNVRHYFQGPFLNSFKVGNAEIYAYSLAWLIFGMILLMLGTAQKDKMIRVASLVIMILTVGKVFVYDAKELQGLYRVISFFGLGLSLMGLSWFYSKYVFGEQEPNEISDEDPH